MLDQRKYIYMQQMRYNTMRAYVRAMNLNARIQNVARCIAEGGNPTVEPSVKDDYFYLVTEYGEDIFTEAVNRIKLQMKGEGNG